MKFQIKKPKIQTFLLASLLGLLTYPLLALNRPTFILISEGLSFKDVVQDLEQKGVKFKQRIPPRIIIAEVPDTIDLGQISPLEASYVGLVPLTTVESLGPLAVAAARQWNQGRVREARTQRGSAYGVMSSAFVSSSLPSPKNFVVDKKDHHLVARWEALMGTSLYEIQVSLNPDFSDTLIKTQTHRTQVLLALPRLKKETSLYLHVRGLEKGDQTRDITDIKGRWSEAQTLVVSAHQPSPTLSIPQLTSPIDQYESEGFTVILEWISSQQNFKRIQISKTANFKNVLIDEVLSENEYGVPGGALELDGRYFWRVQVWDDQSSDWSGPREFHINPPRTVGADTFVNPEAPQ